MWDFPLTVLNFFISQFGVMGNKNFTDQTDINGVISGSVLTSYVS